MILYFAFFRYTIERAVEIQKRVLRQKNRRGENMQSKREKKPLSRSVIQKIMIYVTYGVSSVFLLKNIFIQDISAIICLSACLFIFSLILFILKKMNRPVDTVRFVTSISLTILVFLISQFSGKSFSDDFLLHLAVIALTGMYLRPKYTKLQVILSTLALVVQFFINPQKAGETGQYFMCVGIYLLAGILVYQVINRGRAFIEESNARAQDAEQLLDNLKQLSAELEHNVQSSFAGIDSMRETNERLNQNASDLLAGSVSITEGAQAVENSCDSVQSKIDETEEQVNRLTNGVKKFEETLAENQQNMTEMSDQMHIVQTAMDEVHQVFQLLAQQMNVIYSVTDQMNKISSSTTMLALNASIEAARAGQSGAGFAVVASKVQDLAVDSNKCSEQVISVVDKMQEQIQETTKQLDESNLAINNSLETLLGLQNGFSQLTSRFDSLYETIESQNGSIKQVDSIFEALKTDIEKMSHVSEENQATVEDIAQAMNSYKDNMDLMIQDTQQVYQMSANLMNLAQQQHEDQE